MIRANKNLNAREALLAIGAALLGSLAIYVAYRGASSALHRRRVSAAIPKFLEDLKADRDKLSAAIERYHAHFGFYPPNHSTNPSERAFNNTLYYELMGTRWYSNSHSFGLPTIKDPIEPAEMLKLFNMASFSNTVNSPAWATNFLQGLGFVAREEKDVILLGSGFPLNAPEEFLDDFHVSPWRYEADPAAHNKGKFDLSVELEVQGRKFEVRNW